VRSKKKLAAKESAETPSLSDEQEEKWIEGYVVRDSVVARKRVEDSEAPNKQEQEYMGTAENKGLTTKQPKNTFQKMMVAIRDSLSNLARSDHRDDGEHDHDDETEEGKLSKDDEPSCVMGTISRTVQQRMGRFRQKQMKLDDLTHPGWGDAPNNFHGRGQKYGTSELRVPAFVQPHANYVAAVPTPATFGDLMEYIDVVPGISQIPQGTSRPGICHIILGAGKPQSNMGIAGLAPATELDSSPIEPANPVEIIRFYRCIYQSQLTT